MTPQFLSPQGLLTEKPLVGMCHIHVIPMPGLEVKVEAGNGKAISEISAAQCVVRVCPATQSYYVITYDRDGSNLKERTVHAVPFARVHKLQFQANRHYGGAFIAPLQYVIGQ